jgi:GlpG protein
MRSIGTISDETRARRFGDFLTSQGIDTNVEPAAGGFQIWVLDDDKLQAAAADLTAFQAAPDDPRFAATAGAARAQRDRIESKARRLRRNFIDVRTQFAGGLHRHAPIITLILILLSALVTFQSNFGHNPEIASRLLFSLYPRGAPEIRHGQIWRLITPIFLHYSFFHILFDMWWLWDLGSAVERRRGPWWYLCFILFTGCLSTTTQGLITPGVGGMSGVVYALFGYVWMVGRFRPQEQLGVSTETVWIMLVWLVACFTGWLGPIGNYAHLAGLLLGVLIGYAPTGWLRLRRIVRSK